MIQWVGQNEVYNGKIKPTIGWKRFKYLCNGHLNFIYCLNKNTFIELFEEWSRTALLFGKYAYTLSIDGFNGDYISLKDIITDRPENTKYRCKLYIYANNQEYIQ